MEILENIQKLCVLMGSQTGCLSERSSTVIETESKDYLMWSLEGKALDFFHNNNYRY